MKYYAKYTSEIERVENYELALKDNFKGWNCHHRLETHNSDGERRLVDITRKELIALRMYYDRPPEELIFLTVFDHVSLHHKGKSSPRLGKKTPEETKRKISEANRGKNKGKHCTEEVKNKISEALKGHPVSEETKKKISEAKKGRICNNKGTKWFNNGEINKRCFECPEGFVPGRLR